MLILANFDHKKLCRVCVKRVLNWKCQKINESIVIEIPGIVMILRRYMDISMTFSLVFTEIANCLREKYNPAGRNPSTLLMAIGDNEVLLGLRPNTRWQISRYQYIAEAI
jgi:hypothetical protein